MRTRHVFILLHHSFSFLLSFFLFVFQSAEHPNIFLQSRPFFSPVVIDCDTNCVITIGTISVLIFSKEDISDNVMYIMACYYIFHLTYPKCSRTLPFVLQTEVLMDTIHGGDMTSSNKRVMAVTTMYVDVQSKCSLTSL